MVNTVKAPPATRRSDLHCTCCGGALALPRTCEVWTTPPHPRPRRSAPCTEQREAHNVFDIPTTKRQRAQLSGGTHVGAQARSAHAIGAERVARGGDCSQRLPHPVRHRARSTLGAGRVARGGDQARRRRPGAQRSRHMRRARSATRRWQPAAAGCRPAAAQPAPLWPMSLGGYSLLAQNSD